MDGRKTERISSKKLQKEENAKPKPELKEKKNHKNYNTTNPQNKQKTNPTKFMYVPHYALNGVVPIYTVEDWPPMVWPVTRIIQWCLGKVAQLHALEYLDQ